MGAAARRWTELLERWAIPEPILAQAPEPPWGFLPGMFVDSEGPAAPVEPPSRRLALAALGDGGAVLDVGCGGGAASFELLPAVTWITGLDERPEAIAEFAAAADRRGVPSRGLVGRWPDVADQVEAADVVVCHHVLYNVPFPEPFLQSVTDHARRSVVLELNAAHPLTHLRPLWQQFWALDRPTGPTAEDAVAVVRELGLDPVVEQGERPSGHWRTPEQQVRLTRKRLCLPADRDDEIAAALAELPPAAVEVWTLAWAGRA